MLARLAVLALFALGLAGCNYSETLRYQLDVEVETPAGVRSGSSVIEVTVEEQRGEQIIGNRVRLRAKGEAVTVDLPDGQVLFALLRSEKQVDAAAFYPFRAFNNIRSEGHPYGVEVARYIEGNRLSGPLPRAAYPMLVTFDDLSDPTSVARVDPDDLAASFGEGTQLKRITVQITDDPVTTGIEKRLAWLKQTTVTLLYRPRDTSIGDLPIEYRVGKISFIRSSGS